MTDPTLFGDSAHSAHSPDSPDSADRGDRGDSPDRSDAAVGVIDAAGDAAPPACAEAVAALTAAEPRGAARAPVSPVANGNGLSGSGSAGGGSAGGGSADLSLRRGPGSMVGSNGEADVSAQDTGGGSADLSLRRGPGSMVGSNAEADMSAQDTGGGAASLCGCGGVNASGVGEDPAGWLAALLGVLREGLGSLGAERLEERLGLVGRAESVVAALRCETVSAIAGRRGEAGAAEAVREELRESRGKAKRDVRVAGRLEWLPATAEALAGGAITAQQARMIAEAAEEVSIDEGELLAAAAHQPIDVFGRTVRDHLNARTAGEELEARRRRQRARREFSMRPQADGMYRLSGWLDPLAGAKVQTALGAEYRRLFKAADPKNRPTTTQLYADVLETLVTRQGKAKALRTTLVVVADYDPLADQLADPRLADGTPLAADEFLQLALEAHILPALFDTKGQPLWLGREYRDATTAQRIALAVRDKGCVGCGMANSFCEPHHVKYWDNGGPTDIDNLCLLCGHCHHKEIHSKRGATITREPHGKYTMQRPGHKPNDINQPLRR